MHLWLGPWSSPRAGYFEPPAPALSGIDLRPAGTGPGLGIFPTEGAGDLNPAAFLHLGRSGRGMARGDMDQVRALAGITAEPAALMTPDELALWAVTEGGVKVNPWRPGRRGFRLVQGGRETTGRLWLGDADPARPFILASLQRSYRRLRTQFAGTRQYLRWLAVKAQRFGINPREIVPDDLPFEGVADPTTTLADDFSGDLSAWSDVIGTFSISGGAVVRDAGGGTRHYMRHDTPLSDDSHYAEVVIDTTEGTPSNAVRLGTMTREAGSGADPDRYLGGLSQDGTRAAIYKIVSTTATQVAVTTGLSYAHPTTVRLDSAADDTHTLTNDTVADVTTSDGDVQDQLYVGLGYANSNGTAGVDTWDDFLADDGVVAAVSAVVRNRMTTGYRRGFNLLGRG